MSTTSSDISALLDFPGQKLLDLLPMAAYGVRAPDGVIVWFNSRAVELWGRQPVIGDLDERFCGAHRLYHPDGTYMAHCDTPVAEALKTGVSVHEEDVVIEKPGGSRVTVCVHIDPVFDESGKIVGVVNFFYDVTKRKCRETDARTQAQQLDLAVQEQTASLRALSCRLMNVQDEEWKRLSRELHDGVGQLLALPNMGLDTALMETSQERSTLLNLVREAQRRLQAAIKETRTISYLVHPPLLDDLGFAAAVRKYAEELSARSGISAEVRIPADLPPLTEQMEIALFRVVQEGLTNVHRHSGASKVTISLAMDGNILKLEISDDGKGFDPGKSHGVGLTSMRERLRELQGTLEIQSGTGSRIIAQVPVRLRCKSQAQ